MNRPEILYKLRAVNLSQVRGAWNFRRDLNTLLRRRELHCATRDSLLDRNDCRPRFRHPSPQELPAAIERAVRGTRYSNRAQLKADLGERLSSTSGLDRLRTDFEEMYAPTRIVCLTEDPHSARVWQEYANDGAGWGVGYRPNEEFQPRPVLYQPAPPELPTIGATHEEYVGATLWKTEEYAFEREWRLVHTGLPSLDKWPIPPGCIAQVVLGDKLSVRAEALIVRLAAALPDRPQLMRSKLRSDGTRTLEPVYVDTE